MMDLIISALAFLLVALIAGNTIPGCVGSIISAKILRFRTGVFIAIIGYILGFVIEGSLLQKTFAALMPVKAYSLVIIALMVATVIFLIVHRLRVSISLTVTFTMTVVGISLAYGHGISLSFAALIVLFWIFVAIISFLLTALAIRSVPSLLNGRHLWPALKTIRVLLIVVSFLTAFSIGGNMIGLVFASVNGYADPTIILLGIIFGSIFFSAGELRRLGNEILPVRYLNALISQAMAFGLVEIATLASMPLSVNQVVTSSLYGAGLGYKTRLIRRRPRSTIITTWLITALASFGLGYLLTYLLVVV